MSIDSDQPSGHGDTSDCAPEEDSQFDQIVEDGEARSQSEDWADLELLRGRTAEEVAADLTALGWSQETAAEIAENARRRTRQLRGVTTREEVALAAEASYRRGMAAAPMMMLGGIFGSAIQVGRVVFGFLRSGPLRSNPTLSSNAAAQYPPDGNLSGGRSRELEVINSDEAAKRLEIFATQSAAEATIEWEKWVASELARGQPVMAATNELIARGWNPADAEAIVQRSSGPKLEYGKSHNTTRKPRSQLGLFLALTGGLVGLAGAGQEIAINGKWPIAACFNDRYAVNMILIGVPLMLVGWVWHRCQA